MKIQKPEGIITSPEFHLVSIYSKGSTGFGCWVVVCCWFCFEYMVIRVQPFLGLLFINEEQKSLACDGFDIFVSHAGPCSCRHWHRQNGSAHALGDIERFHRVISFYPFFDQQGYTCSGASEGWVLL